MSVTKTTETTWHSGDWTGEAPRDGRNVRFWEIDGGGVRHGWNITWAEAKQLRDLLVAMLGPGEGKVEP